MSPRKKLKRWLVYILARSLIGLWNLLPLGLALSMGRLLGRLGYYVASGPRNRAQRQMVSALEIDETKAKEITQALFVHCGMLAVELAMLPRIHPNLVDYVQFSEIDKGLLAKALEKRRGVIIVSAHLGNWELLAQRMVAAGFASSTLARLNPNPYLGQWIVQQRASFGLNVIDRSDPGAARSVLSALKQNHLVGFLIDQDTRVQSRHVPFFGRPASTPIGAAQFALRQDIPVFAMFMQREQGKHRISVQEIGLEKYKSRSKEEGIKALTAEMTKHIENAVREHPSEWMWFHERWKTQALLSDEQKGNKVIPS